MVCSLWSSGRVLHYAALIAQWSFALDSAELNLNKTNLNSQRFGHVPAKEEQLAQKAFVFLRLSHVFSLFFKKKPPNVSLLLHYQRLDTA